MMKHISIFSRKHYIIFFIIGICFYLLNQFSPFISDDYFYTFIKGTKIPIESLGDAIKSQIYDYFHYNGRFIIHVIVQYFCGVLGINLFQVLNSICFVFLCIAVTLLLQSEFHKVSKINIPILFVLLLFSSGTAHIYLGNISGAINYLWTSCIILYFFVIYNYNKNTTHHIFYDILIFVGGIIVGSLQESFSFGLSIALFFYYCCNRKSFYGANRWLTSGFWIGTIVCIFSPANFLRLSKTGEGNFDLIVYFVRIYNLILNSEVLILLVVVLIFSFWQNKNRTVSFIRHNVIWILSVIFNIAFVILIAYTGPHQLTSIRLFSIILLMKWLYTFCNNFMIKYNRWITIICSIILVILYIPIYQYRYEIDRGHKELVRKAYVTKDHIVIAPEYCRCCVAKDNWIARNFTHQEIYRQFSKEGLSAVITQAKDVNYIRSILPATKIHISKSCIEKNKIQENVYRAPEKYYYIVRVPTKCNINDINIEIFSQPTVAGRIKGWIFNGNNLTYDKKQITELDYFSDKEYYYIIVYDKPSLPIVNINIQKI